MSRRSDDDAERVRGLMMRALDGELGPSEKAELERIVASDAGIAAEWKELSRVKVATEDLGYRQPPDEIWDGYWISVYNRVERGLGWVLASAGAIVLFGYGLWHVVRELLADATVPGFVKLAIFAALFGGVILFVSVAREKWFLHRRDPYRGVQR